MTPRATSMLSTGVLTLPTCLSPSDILCTVVARTSIPRGASVVSNDNRRKNARQRAASSDNLTWMQKVGLLARNHSVRV